jgi:transcriptional regulator with XRE-family HTH domain
MIYYVPVMQKHNRTYATPGLRAWLEGAGLSLGEAESITGLSRSHLSRLRSGDRRASLGTLLLMCRALGCRLDELITEREAS